MTRRYYRDNFRRNPFIGGLGAPLLGSFVGGLLGSSLGFYGGYRQPYPYYPYPYYYPYTPYPYPPYYGGYY